MCKHKNKPKEKKQQQPISCHCDTTYCLEILHFSHRNGSAKICQGGIVCPLTWKPGLKPKISEPWLALFTGEGEVQKQSSTMEQDWPLKLNFCLSFF